LHLADPSAELARAFKQSNHGINHISYSPDGSRIAWSSVNMIVRIEALGSPGRSILEWDLSSLNEKVRPTERIRGLEFSSDGRLLFVAAADTLCAVELESQSLLWSYTPPRSFGFLVVSPVHLAVAGNGLIAACFDNGSIGVWREDGVLQSIWHDNDSPRVLRFTGNGTQLLGTDSFSLVVWDIDTRRRVSRVRLRDRVYAMDAPAHRPVAVLRTLSSLQIWDLNAMSVSSQVPVGAGFPVVCCHPSDTLFATSDRQCVSIIDYSGHVMDQLPISPAKVFSLAHARTSSDVVIGCNEDTPRFWSRGANAPQ
jgi:WD40 repeat protein